jgi:hypothetical protein
MSAITPDVEVLSVGALIVSKSHAPQPSATAGDTSR